MGRWQVSKEEGKKGKSDGNNSKDKKDSKGKGNGQNGKLDSPYATPKTTGTGSHRRAEDSQELARIKAWYSGVLKQHYTPNAKNYVAVMKRIQNAGSRGEIDEVIKQYCGSKIYTRVQTQLSEAYDEKGKAKVVKIEYKPSEQKEPKDLMTEGKLEQMVADAQPTRAEMRTLEILADARFYAPKKYGRIEKEVMEAYNDEQILAALKKSLRPEDYAKMEFRMRLTQAQEIKRSPLKTIAYGIRNMLGFFGVGSTRDEVAQRIKSKKLKGQSVVLGVHGMAQKENSFMDFEGAIDNFLPLNHGWTNVGEAADRIYAQIKKLVDAGVEGYSLVGHSLGGSIIAEFHRKYVATGKIPKPTRTVYLGVIRSVNRDRPYPADLSIYGNRDWILNAEDFNSLKVSPVKNGMNVELSVGHTELLHHPAVVSLVASFLKMPYSQSWRITEFQNAIWRELDSFNDPDIRRDPKMKINTPKEWLYINGKLPVNPYDRKVA